ncbi:hypothetical protein Ahy_B06g085975 [Arachis hypogaea]|uniref:RNase H type-1 domain-containing protein n=1 Tax=Arachis hypogaea TaxID=3818 RepID=A0A444YWC5_ARAHY|nr:hypothetical protein Ahy_B06g085975 [Arachis hypogaea]
MDINLKGRKFTWFSNPMNGFVTRERLDKVIVKWEWRRLYQNATLTALPAIEFDHCPLVLRLQPKKNFERYFKEGIETTKHVILLCPWTTATWFGVQSQRLPTLETIKSFVEWLLEMCRKIRGQAKEEAEDLIGRIGMLSWEIRKTRNQTIFRNTNPNPNATIIRAKILESEIREAMQRKEKLRQNHNKSISRRSITWRPPPGDWLKANVDDAYSRSTAEGATAVVIRDNSGRLLTGESM